jgi:tRNA A37 threonylcarbamoyltransferase TsaD
LLADRSVCTDNAAMIGILAERKLQLRAEATAPDADIMPNWALG